MKCIALACLVLSLLAGCSTPKPFHPIENGDFYVAGSYTPYNRLSMARPINAVQDTQMAGAGKTITDTYDGYAHSDAGDYFHLLLGYQLSKALDLEAAIFTNSGTAHNFSRTYSLYDPNVDHPPLFELHEGRIDGELHDTGALLTAVASWRFHEYFNAFVRLGASYSQTELESKLEEDIDCRAGSGCIPGDFVNEVKYRTEGFSPVWGIGFTISDVARFEYMTRKIPIGSTASQLSASPAYGTFDPVRIGGTETLHSFMITLRFRLKTMFGGDEE